MKYKIIIDLIDDLLLIIYIITVLDDSFQRFVVIECFMDHYSWNMDQWKKSDLTIRVNNARFTAQGEHSVIPSLTGGEGRSMAYTQRESGEYILEGFTDCWLASLTPLLRLWASLNSQG